MKPICLTHVMINERRLALEARAARLANPRPLVLVHVQMPLQLQLSAVALRTEMTFECADFVLFARDVDLSVTLQIVARLVILAAVEANVGPILRVLALEMSMQLFVIPTDFVTNEAEVPQVLVVNGESVIDK